MDRDYDFDNSNGIGDLCGVDQEGGHRSTSLSSLPVMWNYAVELSASLNSVMVGETRPPSGQVAEPELNVIEHELTYWSNVDGLEF